MRHRNAGKIHDHLWYLGREESGVYLLEGNASSLIISGGMSYLAQTVEAQLNAFGIDETRIGKLLILHTHFDHVGLVPFFRHRCQRLEIIASEKGWKILQMPKAIDTINTFSRMVAERMGMKYCLAGQDLEWHNNLSGITVSEGDMIDLGGITLRVIETPGHSSCSISAYCPEIQALFPSDGGGIPYADRIVASGNSNYTHYQNSLKKLQSLDVKILCADHYGYVTGTDAANYIAGSIAEAADMRSQIETIYFRTNSMEETVKEIIEGIYSNYPDFLLPPEIYTGVCRQMVRHIVGAMANQD